MATSAVGRTGGISDQHPFSADGFLRSISADSSISYGNPDHPSAPSYSVSTAPVLPISAKVALIDAQIDNLELQIRKTITSQRDQLRQRVRSAHTVDRSLNQLWQSMCQTSSRLVALSPSLELVAFDYHQALVESSKQELLTEVLSDLLIATGLLERLETQLHRGDLEALQLDLLRKDDALRPLLSRATLRSLPAVAELHHRFVHLEKQLEEQRRPQRSTEASLPTLPTDSSFQGTNEKGAMARPQLGDDTETLSKTNARAEILDEARQIIISRGPHGGWQEVQIEIEMTLPGIVEPMPSDYAKQPPVESRRAGLLDVSPQVSSPRSSTPLTRNSSLTRSSSNSSNHVVSRANRAKLGARLLRPQDQLGSGPFNEEDVAADDAGWDLDDDLVDLDCAPPSQLPSIAMQPSISTSSSRSASLAIQRLDDDGEDAWGLTEDAPSQTNNVFAEAASSHTARILSPPQRIGEMPSSGVATTSDKDETYDAWGLSDDEPAHSSLQAGTTSGPGLLKDSVEQLNTIMHSSAMPHTVAETGHDDEHAWGLTQASQHPALSLHEISSSISSEQTSLPPHHDQVTVSQGSVSTEPTLAPSSPKEEAAWELEEEEFAPRTSNSDTFLTGTTVAQLSESAVSSAPFEPHQGGEAKHGPDEDEANGEDDAWGLDDEAEEEPALPSASARNISEAQSGHVKTIRSSSPAPRSLRVDGAFATSNSATHHQAPSASAVGAPRAARDASVTVSQIPVTALKATQEALLAAPETRGMEAVHSKRVSKVTISQRSVGLLKLAERTLKRRNPAETGDDLRACGQLAPDVAVATVIDIFELHRSLMPVAHGEVLRDVPSLAMQFFNDCEYLARELMQLTGHSAGGARVITEAQPLDSEDLQKLEDEANLTRSLGQRWFEAQLTAQSKILLDTLMDADGFARTFDESRYQRCERCIIQVVQTLEQLGKAWHPILASSHFCPAMGRLVDLVFQKVLHDVLDLEDIGETESEKLASMIKTLGGLESIFMDEQTQQSSAPLYVPSWFKTSYLIEILTGSLVDIEFLAFEARALVDYSRRELTRLVKALFADTSNRSRLLQKIDSAPPEALAR
ncbi:hypothetical protein BCV70DRAFT_18802 [Testicularia cyperi]|uniref:Retrograde transport protein Dsl1 C-terminal domain-containing protein n=1 Tax=Testicularia cyperi TaxID=1882483 RepID=A0A317Y046_9BASI|nr:hypothetical protein BCV70DRAFT_18802 [Testicularia cyperi]